MFAIACVYAKKKLMIVNDKYNFVHLLFTTHNFTDLHINIEFLQVPVVIKTTTYA
jgi:hypothetical protein